VIVMFAFLVDLGNWFGTARRSDYARPGYA